MAIRIQTSFAKLVHRWLALLAGLAWSGFALPMSLGAQAETPHGQGGGGDSDAKAGDAEATEAPAKPSDQIVIVPPPKELDPEVASEQVLKYLDLGKAEWEGGDYPFAENYFAAALGVPADVPEKEAVLFTMGSLYNRDGLFPKAAAVFERLAREFPDSRRLPDIYMELGNLYRKMGALELAIAKYYMVMNSAINVSFDQLEKYRALSLQAKMEIANTHREREEYNESFRMYQSLFRLDLRPVDRLRVHYQMCYLLFELENYQQAVSQLKLFLDTYPTSYHAPELRYLLAKSYDKLNRKPEALREVVQILQSQSSPDTANPGEGDYWKQRMGNELANEFYEKGDFRSALAIYQALARYSEAPAWRWPAIHQIGLCFERLGLPEKAKLAYEEILAPNGEPTKVEGLDANLRSLHAMAKWRLEHLNWEDDLVARLNVLRTQ